MFNKLFFLCLFFIAASSLITPSKYLIEINSKNGAVDELVVTTNGFTIFTADIVKSLASEDVIQIDLESAPLKMYLNYPGARAGPVYFTIAGSPPAYVEIKIVDNTKRWNRINFLRGTNVISKGKWNILSTGSGTANIAHGVTGSGFEGLSQGKFPACDPDYPMEIAVVNTNHLTDSTENTLSCEYYDCSQLFVTTSSAATGSYSNDLRFVANATTNKARGANYIKGLSSSSGNEASVICYNPEEVINVLYNKNNLFSGSLSLYVIDHSTNNEVTSGKTYINQNIYDPPQSQSSQASIDLRVNYPTASFGNGL